MWIWKWKWKETICFLAGICEQQWSAVWESDITVVIKVLL